MALNIKSYLNHLVGKGWGVQGWVGSAGAYLVIYPSVVRIKECTVDDKLKLNEKKLLLACT